MEALCLKKGAISYQIHWLILMGEKWGLLATYSFTHVIIILVLDAKKIRTHA